MTASPSTPTLHSLLRIGLTIGPLSKPVTISGEGSPFVARWATTLDDLQRELHAHGAELATLEVDLTSRDFRGDGAPRGDRRSPWSDGLRLTFRATALENSPLLSFEAGQFSPWSDNVRALALGLESLRRFDRYGINRGRQYAGMLALPAGRGDPNPANGRLLIAKLGGVTAARRALHPDTGGPTADPDGFADVEAAVAAAEDARRLTATR